MIKVMAVFGTRPEAIKMAPLVHCLKKEKRIDTKVCVTAQHRQMLDSVLDIFNIKPDYDLDIMKDRQTLCGITTRVLEGMDEVLKKENPDIVLVHGDTSTAFVSALAAFYNNTNVGHVEAGLRTYDKWSPFPEEMNRNLIGKLSDLHFSPTFLNKDNLLKENIGEEKIYVTGNTVIDAIKTTVQEGYEFENEELRKIPWKEKRIILMTAHRRENLGEPLYNITRAVRKIVEDFPDVEVVYPVHLNPAVQNVAKEVLGGHDRIHLIEPIGVTELHNAMHLSYMIMTDSGGLQEEAPSLGKPVLVLRTETERPEAVQAGTVKIAGVDEDVIYNEAKTLLCEKEAYDKMAKAVNPYGDGLASERIRDAILHAFGEIKERPADFK